MYTKKLTALLLALLITTPVLAEKPSTAFLDELESLAKFKATDVLQQSVKDYYAKNPALAKGKYPTLLHDAAIMGSLNLLQYLVENDPHGIESAYINGPTPLGYIAGDNQLNSAKILLKAGADPDNPGNTDGVFPLASAVTSGNTKMIRLLLQYDATIHIGAYFQSPLGLALERNDIEILQLFDSFRFVVDSMDDELRIILIEYLNSDLVEEELLRILVAHGLDIYAKTEDKASFIKEYGEKIEHSDIKHMLQDLYDTPYEEKSDKGDSSRESTSEETVTVIEKDKQEEKETDTVNAQSEQTENVATENTEEVPPKEQSLPAVDTKKTRIESDDNIDKIGTIGENADPTGVKNTNNSIQTPDIKTINNTPSVTVTNDADTSQSQNVDSSTNE